MKLHALSVHYAYKLVSTRRALEKTFATNHQDQHGELLVTLLIPIDFSCFLCGEYVLCLGPR